MHIKSFPRRLSHYGGAEAENIRYLSPNLDIRKMHKMYLEANEPEAGLDESIKPKVSYFMYRNYFNKNFKLTFGTPRTDTCKTCDSLNISLKGRLTEQEKHELEEQKTEHQKKYKEFYKILNEAEKAAPTLPINEEVLVFDFQQNVALPTLTTSDQFYARQLWLFNFCIYR